jgi:ubiquinone/menaquinone biosynthesis C-methylase UbiE
MAHLAPPANATRRFSGRVEAYRRYRPRYPRGIIPRLQELCGLTPASIVADIGAGTGMLAELFLENSNRVFAVEPNPEMRAACEELVASYPNLTCIDGTAEETGLPDDSVDFVAVGRAFHWFEQEKCRAEFARILRAEGWVVLAGMGPRKGADPVARDHESVLREYGLDYAALRERYNLGDAARKFFAGGAMQEAEFPGAEKMTYEELEGHTASLSVTPQSGHPRFSAMQRALKDFFARHQSEGKVRLPMNCRIYAGQLR